MSTLAESFQRIVRVIMRDVRYHKFYTGTVQLQHTDGTVDVLLDDESIGGQGLSNIPVRPGIPGTDVESARGARVLVGFANGKPSAPYVAAWETGGLQRIGLARGTRPVARLGDRVELLTAGVLTVTGVVSGTQTIPAAPPAIPEDIVVPIPATPLLGGVATLLGTPTGVLVHGQSQPQSLGDPMDLGDSLRRVIRTIMRETRFHKHYSCTVQGQPDDHRLELLPDDEELRSFGLSAVPIRHGLPGATVRVLVGARVRLGFENGDPRRPFCWLFDPGSIVEIRFDDGRAPIARKGDAAHVMWPPMHISGLVGGLQLEADALLPSSGTGIVREGNEKVRA